MESHEPYNWNDIASRELFFDSIAGNQHKATTKRWKELYPLHATLAVNRCLDIIEKLKPILDESLVIITSDHGQLLGEGMKYHHGYFLDDVLIKVPLYVKFPRGTPNFKQTGDFVSLTEINSLVRSVIHGRPSKLGSEFVFAESFGILVNCDNVFRSERDKRLLELTKARRIRIISHDGSVLYNVNTNQVEDHSGDGISKDQIEKILRQMEGDSDIANDDEFSKEESREVQKRLKLLGYD